ncbi:zinc-dependent peptidase [Ferruginibacter sp. SUN002]|uniref:M90 family metallopeptidase n=1 Tax=Ferruginibacter sp. SUN002 TaxID=2937789 RepID=UPI003D35A180
MNPVLSIIILLLVSLYLFFKLKKKPVKVLPISDQYKAILTAEVPFYRELGIGKKKEFEHRLQRFLATVKITGVNTIVEDIDKVLIAASAIIPIFNFSDWEYPNLNEVLLYPDSFNHDFDQVGDERNILGMVGTGAFNNVMILSQFELRQAFTNLTGKRNTAIHEFVHLIDKTDGSIDGIPTAILEKKYILPWLQLMRQKIEEIRNDDSDIADYGATNESEFFAVVSEYFFERPDLLQDKHPDLYALLIKIFRHQPKL